MRTIVFLLAVTAAAQSWKPAPVTLMTPWGEPGGPVTTVTLRVNREGFVPVADARSSGGGTHFVLVPEADKYRALRAHAGRCAPLCTAVPRASRRLTANARPAPLYAAGAAAAALDVMDSLH